MATYNILTAHTGTTTQQVMTTGDSLYLAKSGTLNSLGHDGAKSSGGENDLQIHGTLAGGSSAFFGKDGGDLIQVYSGATVLGGVVSAITVDGTGDNTFQNAGSVSTHTTSTDVAVIDLEGDNNHVTNTGSIIANQNGTGVLLDGGSNTFNNSGTITAGTDGYNFADGDGVRINGGGANDTTRLQSIVNSGSITALHGTGVFAEGSNNLSNTSSGVISGSLSGVDFSRGRNSVTNSGSIAGGVGVRPGSDQTGLYIGGGTNTVHNSGSISGNYGINILYGTNTVYNATSGHITSTLDDAVYLGANNNYLHNDGHIVSADSDTVYMGLSRNTLYNGTHGHIVSQAYGGDAVYMDEGSDTVTNNGHVTGGTDGNGLYIDDAYNTIVNHAGGVIQVALDNVTTVDSHYAVFAEGVDHLTNDGVITITLGAGNDYNNAAVYFVGGDNSIVNQHQGVVSDGDASSATGNWAIFMEGGSNNVTNKGHITGTIYLGNNSYSDSFNGAHGHFNGWIWGGEGNDAIEVGKGASTIIGGEGADFLQAGAGHNVFEYTSVDNSYGSGASNFDTVDDFNAAKDSMSFSFDNGFASFDSADFATVGGAALTESNFDADIKADVGNHLHANSAVLLQISGGEFAGDSFLIVDGNGTAGYQAGSDYVVELTNVSGTFSASDIQAVI